MPECRLQFQTPLTLRITYQLLQGFAAFHLDWRLQLWSTQHGARHGQPCLPARAAAGAAGAQEVPQRHLQAAVPIDAAAPRSASLQQQAAPRSPSTLTNLISVCIRRDLSNPGRRSYLAVARVTGLTK